MPGYSAVAINDRRIWPIYEVTQDLGVPIIIHTGHSSLPYSKSMEYNHPLFVEDVATDFPELKIIAAAYRYALARGWPDRPRAIPMCTGISPSGAPCRSLRSRRPWSGPSSSASSKSCFGAPIIPNSTSPPRSERY